MLISLQNPNPNSAIFYDIFAWQVCIHNYFANLYEIECASQHYHRTLEKISIWDITDPISTCHISPLEQINEINRPIVQIYKREKGRKRSLPFLDRKLEENKDEEKELDQIPVEYDLNINIEKELDKITQNIPLTELVKFFVHKESSE